MKNIKQTLMASLALAAATMATPTINADAKSDRAPPHSKYLSGNVVANLFSLGKACVFPEGNTCVAIDSMEMRTATKIRISRSIFRLTKDGERQGPDLLNHKLFPHTALAPDGAILDQKFTWTITSDGFCRTKAQLIADEAASQGRAVINGSEPEGKTIIFTGAILKQFRQTFVTAAKAQLGSYYCVKYWIKPGNNDVLLKDIFIDNFLQAYVPDPQIFTNKVGQPHLRPDPS